MRSDAVKYVVIDAQCIHTVVVSESVILYVR